MPGPDGQSNDIRDLTGPPSENSSGTQTAVLNTEHTLASINTVGSFELLVDLVNMAAGDLLELRAKKIVLTAGTGRVLYEQTFQDAQQNEIIVVSEQVGNDLTDTASVAFTLKQTAGATGRSFPWKVLSY